MARLRARSASARAMIGALIIRPLMAKAPRVAAADAGESASVNVRVSASWSDAYTLPGSSVEYYREGSLADAIAELFPGASIGTHGEAYWIADSPVHGLQVVLNTRDVSDVSEALGLG